MNTKTLTPDVAVAMIESTEATPNTIRNLAEELLRSGEIIEDSTFADAKIALQRHYAAR